MSETDSPHRLGVPLRRAGDELLEQALLVLGESPDSAAIHRVRVALKRLRAWLRLGTDRDDDRVGQLDHEWRDLNRTLSPSRNAQALADSWRRFRDRSGRRIRAAQSIIEPEWTAGLQRSTAEARAAWPEIAHRLAQSRIVWQGLVNDDMPVDTLIDRLLHTYRRGRKVSRQLTRSSTAEDWHQFRKLAKRWQYQCELVSRWTSGAGLAVGWEQLTDRLGHFRDRKLLHLSIRQTVTESSARERVLERLEQQQRRCARRLLKQGRTLYSLKRRAMREQLMRRLVAPSEVAPVEPRDAH